MPNPIKYTTGTETLALKKGNFYIGTGDVGKGPSDVTGFYQGLSPSEGGYVIYMNRSGAPGDLSYHNAPTDNDLITFTNNLAGQSYTTVQECLVYYAGQSDKVVLNRDYEGIVTDGLVLNLDAGFTPSYPKNGTTWYDVGGSNNGTLTNGPTFSGDSIVFDGTNDYVDVVGTSFNTPITVETICRFNNVASDTSNFRYIFSLGSNTLGQMISLSKSRTVSPVGTLQPNQGYIYLGGGQDNGLRNIDYIFTGSAYHDVVVQVLPDNQTIKCYIDGAEVGVQSNTLTISLGSTLNLGRWMANLWYLDGNIQTFKVYNRVLTQEEILQNFNAQKGRFGL